MSSPLLASKTDRRDGSVPDTLPSSPTGVRFGSAAVPGGSGGGGGGGVELATSPPSGGLAMSPTQTHEPRGSSRSGTSSGSGSSKRSKDKEATTYSSISNTGVVLTIGNGASGSNLPNASTQSAVAPAIATPAPASSTSSSSTTQSSTSTSTTTSSSSSSSTTSTTQPTASTGTTLLATAAQGGSSSSLGGSGGFVGSLGGGGSGGGGGGGGVGAVSSTSTNNSGGSGVGSGTRRKTHKKQRSKERLEALEMPEDKLIRSKLVQELLTSEEAHVQSLDILVRDYCEPLRSADILTPTVVQDMFCNLELIRNWHAAFLDRFKAHLQCGDTFGEVFLDMIPLLRQLYTQYNENYDHAMDTYEKAKKNKQFAAFLERKQREINENKDLLTYLYLPIQRMIAYDSLLKDILSRTPPTHRDFTHLSDALQSLRDIQFNASLRAKQRKNIDKVIHIQNRIAGTTQLALPHRRYVYEGRVLFIQPDGESSKERYCFLFNDLFVCCKEKKKGMVLEVEFKEPLGTLKVEDMDDSSEFRYLFKLTSSANEYVFSTSDKHHWISLIAQYISLLKTEGAEAPHNDVEESSRESLINRIIKWSKMDDAEEVLAQVCELAAILERYKTMNVPHTGPATTTQY